MTGVEDICICIPTRRPASMKTLNSFEIPENVRVFILADPDVWHSQNDFYHRRPGISVLVGKRGMAPQAALCYEVAAAYHYKRFLRLDDDLPPDVFVHKDGHNPGIREILFELSICMDKLGVSLAGLQNLTNRGWMKEGYSKTYTQIAGGVSMAISARFSETFIHGELRRTEDTWKTCAHRQYDIERGTGGGVNGRVNSIGFDSERCMGGPDSVVDVTQEDVDHDMRMMVDHFPHLIEFHGQYPDDHGGRYRSYRKKYLRWKKQ